MTLHEKQPLMTGNARIITINSGSSSIKFAVYCAGGGMERELSGKIARIGLDKPGCTIVYDKNGEKKNLPIRAANFNEAAEFLIDWFEKQPGFDTVKCIGHRIVHGLKHTHAEIVSDELLNDLNKITAYDPDHLPAEIEMVQAFKKRHPALVQVACFDTAFHAGMPSVAKILPVPRRFYNAGIQKYGFHGISYSYLMEALAAKVGSTAKGRVILAHLGSGASLAAVNGGKSIDTTMGFTPAGGLVMGTRSGDVDPGVAWYITQSENLSAGQFNQLINHQSGLLGVSETTSDMQDLLQKESTDARAADATALFCYTIKKWIGAYTAVLGGLDILVFSGGIGENSPVVRSRICEGLGYLGIAVDEGLNNANAEVISTGGAVKVMVVPTNEELMIAKSAVQIYDESLNARHSV